MMDLREQLLAEIDRQSEICQNDLAPEVLFFSAFTRDAVRGALRALRREIERHGEAEMVAAGKSEPWCRWCGPTWPCETLRLTAADFGIGGSNA